MKGHLAEAPNPKMTQRGDYSTQTVCRNRFAGIPRSEHCQGPGNSPYVRRKDSSGFHVGKIVLKPIQKAACSKGGS